MRTAVARVELHIGGAQSLKAKRAVLRPVIERLKRSMSVSVAEVDHQDTWQRAAIGVAWVARDAIELDRLIDATRRHFDRQLECEMVDFVIRHMEEPDG
jgi:hypothetical protein